MIDRQTQVVGAGGCPPGTKFATNLWIQYRPRRGREFAACTERGDWQVHLSWVSRTTENPEMPAALHGDSERADYFRYESQLPGL
jgi:hypothetical protein